jgi:drug/metabolite transporter (DMT)-like permease
MEAGAAIVTAESLLALTPIAIKSIPLDPLSAVWSRILTSAALGAFLADSRQFKMRELTSAASLGALNLAHIASSYESFRHLPAGQAMSLLYTYPLWNLILGAVVRMEAIPSQTYFWMATATAGSVLLNVDPGRTATPAISSVKPDRFWGLGMGLLMALTESGMFTLTKMIGWTDAAKLVWVLNASAGIWLTLATLLGLVNFPPFLGFLGFLGDGPQLRPPPKNQKSQWITMEMAALTAFHAVVLFAGYWLRFYAIPRLSTVTYSILSYSGLLAAYFYGLMFMGERPGWISAAGAAIIVFSGLMIEWA